MKEYTVTFHLTPEQEAAIEALKDGNRTIEYAFASMMQYGSTYDIDKKIELWRLMAEHGKRNRDAESIESEKATA